MINPAPIQKVTVEIQGSKIVLDPSNMKYNENSLAEYMNEEYGWIDYLGKQLEFASKELALAEIEYDWLFSKKLTEIKDSGASDVYSKSAATADLDVKKARIKIAECKEVVGHLRAHLKAWDRNHENVQNRGHSLRAEMKVLNREIHPTQDDNSDSPFGTYLK